jgi:hypothetical protein
MEVNNHGFFNCDMPPDWKMHNRGVTPIFWIEVVDLFKDALPRACHQASA